MLRAVWIGVNPADEALAGSGHRAPHGDSPSAQDELAAVGSLAHLNARPAEGVAAAGDGDRSRIYHTTNGGQSWTLQFRNAEPRAFFDCLDFWDARRGLAFSDAVDGHFVILTTNDAGRHWTRVPDEALPAARLCMSCKRQRSSR